MDLGSLVSPKRLRIKWRKALCFKGPYRGFPGCECHLICPLLRSGLFEQEDFLALRDASPDYAQVSATLADYSGM